MSRTLIPGRPSIRAPLSTTALGGRPAHPHGAELLGDPHACMHVAVEKLQCAHGKLVNLSIPTSTCHLVRPRLTL